jgi:hypothetical protein
MSEIDLHFCSPSDDAPTTSGIYFSKERADISLSRTVWFSVFRLVRRRLMKAVFFLRLESSDPESLKMSIVRGEDRYSIPVSPSHTRLFSRLSSLLRSRRVRSSDDSPTMNTWLWLVSSLVVATLSGTYLARGGLRPAFRRHTACQFKLSIQTKMRYRISLGTDAIQCGFRFGPKCHR